jgi:hypothetical protein
MQTYSINGSGGTICSGIPSLDVAISIASDLARWGEDDNDRIARFGITAIHEPYDGVDNGGVNIYRLRRREHHWMFWARVNPEPPRCPACRRTL